MSTLAKDLGIKVLCTLDLLKLMLDAEHIDIVKVRSIAGYWVHVADCPKDFKTDFKRIFGEDAP
jgi:hypothetical protein